MGGGEEADQNDGTDRTSADAKALLPARQVHAEAREEQAPAVAEDDVRRGDAAVGRTSMSSLALVAKLIRFIPAPAASLL